MKCVCSYVTHDRSNFNRHEKGCRHVLQLKLDSLSKDNEELRSRLRDRETTIHEQSALLQEKEECILLLKTQVNDIIKTPKYVTNVRATINVHPFLQEPFDELPPYNEVRSLLQTPSESLPKFIQLKHFGAQSTLRNLRLPNRRGNTIQIVQRVGDELKWIHKDRRELLDLLMETNVEQLRDDYDADNIKIWKQWYETRLTVEWKEQVGKVELVLFNNQ